MALNVILERLYSMVLATPGPGSTLPEVASLLSPHLRYYRREHPAPGRRRGKFEHQLFMLMKEVDDGILFPMGLIPRVLEVCRVQNVVYTTHVVRKCEVPTPDLTRLDPCDDVARAQDQQRVLAHLFTQDYGIIKAPTAFGKSYVLVQACLAYPDTKIVVCTRRKDVVQTLWGRLERKVPFGQLGIVGGGKDSPARITISTAKSLKKTDTENCELLLYDEVHEAAAPETCRLVGAFRKARRFGFSASPFGRSDGADRLTEAMFGPIVCEISYKDAQAKGSVARIDVHVYPVPGVRIGTDDLTAQFRHGIWRNDMRNRMIAALAMRHAASGQQTLVLVDKLEHAFRLRKHLPNWPVVYSDMDTEQRDTFRRWGLIRDSEPRMTPERREKFRLEFEAGRLRAAISTGIWNTGVDFCHLDVLVRGDGLSSTISNTQTPGRLSRGQYGLLIDFMDGFDDRFSRRSEKRFASYRGKGWTLLPQPFPKEELATVSV